MIEIVKIAKRLYKCSICGNEVVSETNHRVDTYPNCKGTCHQIIEDGKGGRRIPKQTPHNYIKDL